MLHAKPSGVGGLALALPADTRHAGSKSKERKETHSWSGPMMIDPHPLYSFYTIWPGLIIVVVIPFLCKDLPNLDALFSLSPSPYSSDLQGRPGFFSNGLSRRGIAIVTSWKNGDKNKTKILRSESLVPSHSCSYCLRHVQLRRRLATPLEIGNRWISGALGRNSSNDTWKRTTRRRIESSINNKDRVSRLCGGWSYLLRPMPSTMKGRVGWFRRKRAHSSWFCPLKETATPGPSPEASDKSTGRIWKYKRKAILITEGKRQLQRTTLPQHTRHSKSYPWIRLNSLSKSVKRLVKNLTGLFDKITVLLHER